MRNSAHLQRLRMQWACRSGRRPLAAGLGAMLLLGGCRGGAVTQSFAWLSPPVRHVEINEQTVRLQHALPAPAKKAASEILPAGHTESVGDNLAEPIAVDATDRNLALADVVAPDEPTPPDGEKPVGRATVDVTFNQVVYWAIHHHPTIAAGMEGIRQSQGDYLQSSLLPNPSLFTDGQLMPLTRPFTPTKQGGPPQQDVILTYPIDWWVFGKRTAAMQAAHLNVHVNQADFEDLVRQRILAASNAFYNALEAAALEELAALNVKNLERLELITQKSVEDGGRARVDLNRVRLDLLSARQFYRTSQAATLSAAAELRSVTGQGAGGALIRASGDLSAPLNGGPMPTDQAYSIAESRRPDMNSVRWRVQEAAAKVDVEELAAKPTLAPALGYTRQYQNSIGYPDANSWSASLTMSVPIFDKNQGNIQKACATQRQLQWQYQSLRLSVRAEVEQAAAELDAAFENASTVAEEQLKLAADVQESIGKAYQAGERSLIDVLDAQRNYRETNRLFVTTRAAYWRALYAYYAAIGGQQSQQQ